MRVLITSTGGAGHVHPMVPIALALRDAGHEVRWATSTDAAPTLERAGIDLAPCGIGLAERAAKLFAGWPDVLHKPPRARRAALLPALFSALSVERMFDDLIELTDPWRPDIVLHEPCEFAAAPLAEHLGIPHVTVGFGRFLPADLLSPAPTEIAELWARVGHDVPVDLGLEAHAYLHPLPPSLEPADGPNVSLMRPLGFDGNGTVADSGVDAPTRPRPGVYVTYGTEFGRMAPWRAILDGLGTVDADVLVTVGGLVDPADLDPIPANIRVDRYVPQHVAIRDADLVVSHGGSGAMLGALGAGLAQLVLPFAADHFENADMLTDAGLARSIEPEDVDAGSIARAVTGLLDDPTVTDGAREVAVELAAMPAPAELVPVLMSLIA
jgi:UDP:flavonoid glycosyltransferase YjiC (YdhE family)